MLVDLLHTASVAWPSAEDGDASFCTSMPDRLASRSTYHAGLGLDCNRHPSPSASSCSSQAATTSAAPKGFCHSANVMRVCEDDNLSFPSGQLPSHSLAFNLC